MDPITMAIVAALAAGLASGSTKVGQQAIIDAYQALKDLLKKKYEGKGELLKAVESLETNPDSAGRKATLQEEVTKAKVEQDLEIIDAAQTLLKRLNVSPDGGKMSATGSYIAQADRASSASVNINQPKQSP